jgi:hypothetical protein
MPAPLGRTELGEKPRVVEVLEGGNEPPIVGDKGVAVKGRVLQVKNPVV